MMITVRTVVRAFEYRPDYYSRELSVSGTVTLRPEMVAAYVHDTDGLHIHLAGGLSFTIHPEDWPALEAKLKGDNPAGAAEFAARLKAHLSKTPAPLTGLYDHIDAVTASYGKAADGEAAQFAARLKAHFNAYTIWNARLGYSTMPLTTVQEIIDTALASYAKERK